MHGTVAEGSLGDDPRQRRERCSLKVATGVGARHIQGGWTRSVSLEAGTFTELHAKLAPMAGGYPFVPKYQLPGSCLEDLVRARAEMGRVVDAAWWLWRAWFPTNVHDAGSSFLSRAPSP